MFTVAILSSLILANAQTLDGLPNDRPPPRRAPTPASETTLSPPRRDCAFGEEWTTCSSSSCFERRCDTPPTRICTKDCKVGCHCAAGYARYGQICINVTQCPPPTPSDSNFNQTEQQCGRNEVWTKCSSSSCFETRCDTPPTNICTRDCKTGCKCANGYARSGTNCINQTHCPPSNASSSNNGFRMGKLGKALGKLGKLLRPNATATKPPTPPSNPPSASAPTAAAITLFVGPSKQACDSGSKQCLVTKTVDAQRFVAQIKVIDGFDFEPGFNYQLRVRPTGQAAYILVKLVKKTPAAPATPPAGSSSKCAEVMCMMFCDNGYKKDANGCEICSCLPAPAVVACPLVACDNLCPTTGYAKDAKGCTTCACAPFATTVSGCTSTDGWNLAKVAACCVPPPPPGTVTSALCNSGLQTGFISSPPN